MMELRETLDILRKEDLLKKLETSGYAFAAWRLPNSPESHLIVSLQKARKLEEFQLSDLDSGFLINEFDDNHPTKPFHINADIIFRNDEVAINPRVKSSQLDQFKNDIKSIPDTVHASNPTRPPSEISYESRVSEAIDQIKAGTFEKVVLSRYRDEKLPEDFSAWSFFEALCANYPNAFTSITYIPGKGMWIGATPELLLSDNHECFRTVALAGTKTLANQSLSEIAWTQKEIEEQALVSRYIINCFKKIRLREFHEHGPKTIQAGSLAHLKTEFVVDYREITFENLADQMLELLHPTSAVCGMPIEQTKPWIRDVENYNREFYTGFLGPVNFDNSTDLFVNLRCMKVENGLARFFAGAGITEDSIPYKELQETEMKMNILRSMLYGNSY